MARFWCARGCRSSSCECPGISCMRLKSAILSDVRRQRFTSSLALHTFEVVEDIVLKKVSETGEYGAKNTAPSRIGVGTVCTKLVMG